MNEREIFDAALAIADPHERDAFLGRACDGDPGLQEHLRGLLEMERKLGRFLEAPGSPPTMTIDSPRLAEARAWFDRAAREHGRDNGPPGSGYKEAHDEVAALLGQAALPADVFARP